MKTLVKILLAIVFIIAIVLNCMSASYAAEPTESEPAPAHLYAYDYVVRIQSEYNNAQFLTRISNKQMVNDFMWLVDHSIYEINVDNWNAFQSRYTIFLQAKRQYQQGWNIEFDDFLN